MNKDPLILTLPVNSWLLEIVLPNLVEPVTNSIEDDMVCTTNVKALIVLVTVNDPVINVLPDMLTAPLLTVNIAEAVAALVDASAIRTLPIAGLFIVLNPVPEEPDDPLDPDEPALPLLPDVPLVPEDPLDPEDPVEPELPAVPLVPDVPVLPLLPDDPLLPAVPDVPEVPVEPDDPLEPALPDVPEVPLLPLEPVLPEDPLEPVVPEVPLVPAVPDVPLVPEVFVVEDLKKNCPLPVSTTT
jgi:hypothetical protein